MLLFGDIFNRQLLLLSVFLTVSQSFFPAGFQTPGFLRRRNPAVQHTDPPALHVNHTGSESH